jgi:L-malate glycosyltransferase
MTITHVVNSLQVGGMEHFVLRLACAQRRGGHQVSILALHSGELADEAHLSGVPVTILGGSSKELRVLRAARFFFSVKPQIIHAHNQTSLHYAVLGKRIGKAAVLMTNHGQGLGSRRTPSAAEWSQTDAVVAVSNAVAERMNQGTLGTKLRTIYNGVAFSPPQRTRAQVFEELGIPEGRTVGVMVARIDHLKGHETLIAALGQLREANLPLTILVAGDGAQRTEREQQASELGLSVNNVRFLGFRSDVPDLLAASDFFVLPSLTEGLPLSVLEAMSHQLPIIATPVGGIPELVEHQKHGLLVAVEDSQMLAETIRRLSMDCSLRKSMGEAGFKRVQETFTYAQMSSAYASLYSELIVGSKRGSK